MRYVLSLNGNRYAYECEPPEWKERGTGDVRILKKPSNESARILMRREKTLKVCANHFILPWMNMKPNCGSDKELFMNVDMHTAQCTSSVFKYMRMRRHFLKKLVNHLTCIIDIYDGPGAGLGVGNQSGLRGRGAQAGGG